jgi:hypothetical protein
MIVTITNPKGMDFCINQLQSWLQSELFARWEIDPDVPAESNRYKFLPRVNRNPDEKNGFIAELYLGNGEYKEVYWDDTLTGFTWFGLGSKILQEDGQQVADIHLVTFANLKKLYPDIDHRADNELRMDFQKVFEAPIFGFTLISTEIWLPNVLREYPGSRRDNRLKAADMGNVHAFRLNLELRFTPSEACSNPYS